MRLVFQPGCQTLADCSELGGKYLSRVPAFRATARRSTMKCSGARRNWARKCATWRRWGEFNSTPEGEQKVEVKFHLEQSTFNISIPIHRSRQKRLPRVGGGRVRHGGAAGATRRLVPAE
jgi:hypothetical protein